MHWVLVHFCNTAERASCFFILSCFHCYKEKNQVIACTHNLSVLALLTTLLNGLLCNLCLSPPPPPTHPQIQMPNEVGYMSPKPVTAFLFLYFPSHEVHEPKRRDHFMTKRNKRADTCLPKREAFSNHIDNDGNTLIARWNAFQYLQNMLIAPF